MKPHAHKTENHSPPAKKPTVNVAPPVIIPPAPPIDDLEIRLAALERKVEELSQQREPQVIYKGNS